MKIAVTALLLLTPAAFAQQKFDVQDVRRTFISDCAMRGMSKGDDPERVTKFCACSFDVLATNLTVAEYLEVDRVGKTKGRPEILPQMERALPKIGQQCKGS